MRIKGIPGHDRCSENSCEGGPFSCMSTDEVYTPTYEDNLGMDPIKEAQKRILEKAIERLEGKKNDYMTFVEKGTDGMLKLDLALMQKYYRRGIDEAITELKSLMGEV